MSNAHSLPPSSPCVNVLYDPLLTDSPIVAEVCLGLEEQGVPCRAMAGTAGHTARQLGQHAARTAPLRVGLGIGARGEVILTHAQLADNYALRICPPGSTPAALRNIGANGGQLVKVIPFSDPL